MVKLKNSFLDTLRLIPFPMMRILLRNKTVGGGPAPSVHYGTEQNAQQNV